MSNPVPPTPRRGVRPELPKELRRRPVPTTPVTATRPSSSGRRGPQQYAETDRKGPPRPLRFQHGTAGHELMRDLHPWPRSLLAAALCAG